MRPRTGSMRAMSRSRKVPVTIASPLGAAAPRQTKMGPKAHQKQKAPRGAFHSYAPQAYRTASITDRRQPGLPPPPACVKTRGGPGILPELPRRREQGRHYFRPAGSPSALDLYRQPGRKAAMMVPPEPPD